MNDNIEDAKKNVRPERAYKSLPIIIFNNSLSIGHICNGEYFTIFRCEKIRFIVCSLPLRQIFIEQNRSCKSQIFIKRIIKMKFPYIYFLLALFHRRICIEKIISSLFFTAIGTHRKKRKKEKIPTRKKNATKFMIAHNH